MARFARQLWRARSRRNYQFLLMLTGMAVLNLLFLQQSAAGHYLLALHLGHSMILLFGVLMGVLGGRVIPFFTARATNTPQCQTPRLDLLLLVSAIAGTIGFISSIWWSLLNPGWLMLLVALLHLLRLGYWFTPKLLAQPLLWSLHVANLALAVGLALMAIALLSAPATLPRPTLFKDALHLVGISAMAGMMLAMMARGRTRPYRPRVTSQPLAGTGFCRSVSQWPAARRCRTFATTTTELVQQCRLLVMRFCHFHPGLLAHPDFSPAGWPAGLILSHS